MIYRIKQKALNTMMSIIVLVTLILFYGNGNTVLAASASLGGPSSVRAGDTITLTLTISAPGSYGLEGTLSYDGSSLTLTGINISVNGWKLETNGNRIVAYDDTLSNPLGNSTQVITATFKVSNSLAAGTNISVSFSGLIATDGTNESNLGNAGYSTAILPPLSGNTNLSSLDVSGVSLTPAFNSKTTTYNVGEVDYSVSSLDINAVAEDSKSVVSINGNSLDVGANTVSITVKAENGAVNTYYINVTRKQDPNYVPSSNASLSAITLSTGVLSPAFSPDITEYVVYLPFEAASISASGIAADSKAGEVLGGELYELAVGENKLIVTGNAEDGTKKEYTISVIVMPEYKGVLPKIEGVKLPEPTTEEITTEAPTTEPTTSADVTKREENNGSGGISVAIVILLMIIAAGAGFGICFLLMNRLHHNKQIS